ncbi:MAG: trigger factor [Treponema sp.]|nr:trigger factor [Treponema sp.]
MPVSKDIERLPHSAVKLTLTVGKDEVRARYDELVAEYVKSAMVPGFRKGKVPRDVLERKFGSALRDEALNKIFGKAITETFEDEGFPKEDQPLHYSTPRLEGEPELDFDRDLSFSVVYDVLPKVTVGPWKGLEAELPFVEVAPEDVNRELEGIRERNAIVLDRDDGAASAKDDVVTVNYSELDGGEPMPGSEREDFVFTLGSAYNLYQFDDELLGMKKGETRDITKTFPADYLHKELAGRTVTIRVTLTALKERKLPDLDDDLAQDVDEKYQTLEDLKKNVREGLEKNLEKRRRDMAVSRLLEQVLEKTPIDLPESMVNLEIDSRVRRLARQFGMGAEEMEKRLAEDRNVREEWRPDAEKALKSRLIVETLMDELKLEATEEEIEKEIEDRSSLSAAQEDVKKYYAGKETRNYLKEDIRERKLFDLFLAENKIKKGKKESYLDFMNEKG